jgi:hypothetical protein
LPAGSEYLGKQVKLYVSFPATKSVGSVYVYHGSVSSTNFLLEFNGGTTLGNTQEVYTFECEPVVIGDRSYGVT